MSINQSNLSAPQFGYDFVVATTLQSLNSTMFEFINTANFPVISKYYWTDANNDTVEVDLQTLMNTPQSNTDPSGTAGVDPATVADWDGTGTQPTGMIQIGGSSFACGFKAQVGIPPGFALPGAPNPQNLPVLPNIVSFNQTSMSVIFNLYCSSFQVFQPTWGRRGVGSYLNQSQPSGAAWYLQTVIPINKILDNSNLPKAVQKQLDALDAMGEDFSVQRLFIDLDQPSKATASSIIFGGIQPGSALQTVISEVFTGAYCTTLNASGMPALGYTILPNTPPPLSASLALGTMEIEIVPYAAPSGGGNTLPGLDTFNYLCSQSATLPAANLLTWNWFDTQEEAAQYSGVVAVNRKALAGYFASELTQHVANNCLQPTVSTSTSWPTMYWNFSMAYVTPPPASYPSSGSTILSFSYGSQNSYDDSGTKWPPMLDYHSFDMRSSYSLDVQCEGNTITIVQHLVVYAEVCYMDTCESGNFVDKTITDVYTLSIGQGGNLVVSPPTSTPQDNSEKPDANWFVDLFTSINDIVDWVHNNVSFAATNLTDVPLNTMQQFVFPGGKTFAYADVAFSDTQDLVSHVTYTTPA
ncbi:MAG: hypothetical protein KGZ83_12625 [Sulfuricella sp.]|nr:hypothetical protein [Sulfuricella sp.]